MTQEAKRSDWVKFILVMLVFIVGMVFLLLYNIHHPLIWIAYITLWTWVEIKVAKNIHLKWWVWVLILLGLSVLDYFIIHLIDSI